MPKDLPQDKPQTAESLSQEPAASRDAEICKAVSVFFDCRTCSTIARR